MSVFFKALSPLLLMMVISNSYAKSIQVAEYAADDVEAAAAEAVAMSTDYAAADTACSASENCDVATSVSDDDRYGGIEREYVVKGCKVTIYNDGPVKMVNEKTDQPCNAPIPKNHKFSKNVRTYEENGCIITESVAADGMTDAVKDCSKKSKKK